MIDLFAGVGGLSEGFRQASNRYRVVTAVEMDARAAAGHALNHGADVHVGPIQDWLRDAEVPEVDVVIGGPPCQGFSALGSRREDDERNVLWRHYAETVARATPRFFVLENVPQFAASSQFELFRGMTGTGGVLEDYDFEHHLVNAADHGTAQVRKRVIVIGRRRDQDRPGFPEPSHERRDLPTRSLPDWITLRGVIPTLPVPGPLVDGRTHVLADGTTAPGAFRADELHVARNYTDLSLRRFEAIPTGGNRFDLPDELKCAAWRKHTSGSGDVMGRLRWDRPSVTIRTEFVKPEKGRYIHPVEHRAITAYEGALIQGFPPGYLFVGSMTDIVRQIGNAVPIPLGRAVASHLLGRLTGETVAVGASTSPPIPGLVA